MRRERPLLFFALVYPTLLTWFYFVVIGGQGTETNVLQQAVYAVGKAFQLALPCLFLLWFDRSRLQLARPRFDQLWLAVGFGLLTSAAMLLLYFVGLKPLGLFATTPQRIGLKLQQFGLNSILGFLGLGVFIALFHSLLEEYYWRWFVFGRLRDHYSFAPACVLSSLGFMGHHVFILGEFLPGYFWTAAVPLSLCIAVGGAVWAWLYERTKTIYAAWLSHLLIDVTIFVVGYDLIREQLH